MLGDRCRPERPVNPLVATHHLPAPPVKLLLSYKEVENVRVLESGHVDCLSWSTDGLFCECFSDNVRSLKSESLIRS
jgi:hypothetical protein